MNNPPKYQIIGVSSYRTEGEATGPFSGLTGTPTEVAYFDALGNGTSDSYFTRDENTKEGVMNFEVYAVGSINDGSSQEVQWKADNAGATGNSIALVFDGVDDTDTVLAAWNLANPTNTASVVGGTGNFVPPAGTAQFVGGGTSGYQNQLDLLGQGYQASASVYTDGGTRFAINGILNVGRGMNPFMAAFDFAGASTIMEMTTTDFDLSTSDGSTYNTFLALNDVRASLIYESTANGDSGIRAQDSELRLYNKGIQTNWPTTAGTTGQVLTKIAANQLGWSTPGTTTALTQNYIGYGNASNILTGNSNFTYTPATGRFNLTGTNSTFYVRDDEKKIYGIVSSGLGEDYTLSINGTSGHARFEAFDGSSLYNYVGTSSITAYIQSQDGSNSTAFQTIATSASATATNGTSTMTMQVSPTLYQVTGSVNSVGITVDDSNKTLAVAKSIIRGDTLHNSAVAQGSATQQDIRSGTYTPTLTGVTNVSSTTSYEAQWSRVGNVVTVSGKIGVEPTANNTSTRVRISLPVASNFATEQQCAGSGSNVDTTSTAHSARVVADTTNNEAEFGYYETHGTSSEDMTFQFTYLVI